MTKSIRTLEMQGPQGKIKITLEGPVVKHFLSIAQVLEMYLNDENASAMAANLMASRKTIIESNGTTPRPESTTSNSHNSSSLQHDNVEAYFDNMTIIDRLKHLIRASIKMGWANSREIKELYEYHFQTEVSLSTISTYLKRLSEEGILEKRGSKSNLEYRLSPAWHDQIPEVPLPRPTSSANSGGENATTQHLTVKESNSHDS